MSKDSYEKLTMIKRDLNLDFDDAYQFKIAKEYGLEIITMDRDFNKVKDKIRVKFIEGIV
ncbi:MAG: PIN domain-containing protein [Candidatus Scalindua sp.]|nr:PIN domain-containing protein [Candidatus Scalindua sp.]